MIMRMGMTKIRILTGSPLPSSDSLLELIINFRKYFLELAQWPENCLEQPCEDKDVNLMQPRYCRI